MIFNRNFFRLHLLRKWARLSRYKRIQDEFCWSIESEISSFSRYSSNTKMSVCGMKRVGKWLNRRSSGWYKESKFVEKEEGIFSFISLWFCYYYFIIVFVGIYIVLSLLHPPPPLWGGKIDIIFHLCGGWTAMTTT